MNFKKHAVAAALTLGGLISGAAMAESLDEVTLEVVDVNTQEAGEVTRQIEIPKTLQEQAQKRNRERHEYRTGEGDGLREQTRERSELREQQQSQTREQLRDNAEAVKQESQDQLQEMQEVKQQQHQGMKR